MYSDEQILAALYETLDCALKDLSTLLVSDHPPRNYLNKYWEEIKIVSDLQSLILDHETRMAAKTLISLF